MAREGMSPHYLRHAALGGSYVVLADRHKLEPTDRVYDVEQWRANFMKLPRYYVTCYFGDERHFWDVPNLPDAEHLFAELEESLHAS